MLITLQLGAKFTGDGQLKLEGTINGLVEMFQKAARFESLVLAGNELAQYCQETALKKIDCFSVEEARRLSWLAKQWENSRAF